MEKAVEAVEKEIQSIQAAPPPQQEIQRAVKQARALFAYGSETISNQALWLGFSQMFADYVWFTSYLERLAAVTPEQVQRIAQLYLRPHQRVLGFYKPTEDISQPVASENGL